MPGNRRSTAPTLAAGLAAFAAAAALSVAPSPAGTPIASAATCSGAVPVAPGNDLARQIFLGGGGPRGPITVLGDSVLQGAATGVTLPTMLAAHGWGPIRFRSGLGYNTGIGGTSTWEASVSNWVCWWRTQGWNPRTIAVNLGANDVGYPDCSSVAGCKQRIAFLLDEIGPDHDVWWAMTTVFTGTEESKFNQSNWNTALAELAAERPNLVVWDWPAALAASDIVMSWDNTHLGSIRDYEKRSALMAADITERVGAPARRLDSDAPIPSAAAGAAEFVPLADPTRVLDTRQPGSDGSFAAGESRPVDLSTVLPAGASAAALNVTAANAAAAGFLTVWPCTSTRPEVSSVNFTAGGARGAHAVTPVSGEGRVCVYSPVATDVLIDVQGAFVPDQGMTLTPALGRLADTRTNGRVEVVVAEVPAGTVAAVVNLTAIDAGAGGYLTASACDGARPEVSSVNFAPREVVAGSAYVPVGASGKICVYASTPVDVLVDLTGTFAADDSGLRFVAANPARTLDTRNTIGGWRGRQGPGQTIDVAVAPPGARAVTGTLTVATAGLATYLTAWPCGDPMPATSNLNAPLAGTTANSLTVGVSPESRLCVSSFSSGHTLFDTTGWWVS